jgi:hypothetical protein
MLRIRSPQDMGAAVVFVLIGLAGIHFGEDLRFGGAARMGPGFFPLYLSWCIVGIGAIIGARSLVFAGPEIEKMRFRPALFVIASLLVFGFAMELLGLFFSAFALIAVAAFAQTKPNLRDTALLAAGMTIFCVVVFVWALGQPLTLFGN